MSKTNNDIEHWEKFKKLPLNHKDVILKYLIKQELPFKKRLTHIRDEIGYPITSQKVTKVLNLATTKRKHIKGDVYYEMEEGHIDIFQDLYDKNLDSIRERDEKIRIRSQKDPRLAVDMKIKDEDLEKIEELLKNYKTLLPKSDYKVHKRTKALFIIAKAFTDWMSPHHPFYTHRLLVTQYNADKKQVTIDGVSNYYYVFYHLPFQVGC